MIMAPVMLVVLLPLLLQANMVVAAEARIKAEWRWQGLASSEYILVDLDLNNKESRKVAAGTDAGVVAKTSLPLPVKAVLAAVLRTAARQVATSNKGNGVTVHFEVKLLPHPEPNQIKVTSR